MFEILGAIDSLIGIAFFIWIIIKFSMDKNVRSRVVDYTKKRNTVMLVIEMFLLIGSIVYLSLVFYFYSRKVDNHSSIWWLVMSLSYLAIFFTIFWSLRRAYSMLLNLQNVKRESTLLFLSYMAIKLVSLKKNSQVLKVIFPLLMITYGATVISLAIYRMNDDLIILNAIFSIITIPLPFLFVNHLTFTTWSADLLKTEVDVSEMPKIDGILTCSDKKAIKLYNKSDEWIRKSFLPEQKDKNISEDIVSLKVLKSRYLLEYIKYEKWNKSSTVENSLFIKAAKTLNSKNDNSVLEKLRKEFEKITTDKYIARLENIFYKL